MAKTFVSVFSSLSLLLFLLVPVGGQEKRVEPVHAGKMVNSKADETDPFLMADGLRMLYAAKGDETFDLMVGARKDIGVFTEAVPLGTLNTKNSDERSPYFYAGNKEFYFASNKIGEEQPKDERNFEIIVRSGEAAPFPLLVLNTPSDEMFPWITANGNEFFFSRKSKDGWRLCVTNGPTTGNPGKGKIIEEIPVGFHHATLTPDGMSMYLEGPVGKDRSGLFLTTRKKVGGAWEKPKALINLNHPDGKKGDMAPSLSASGMTLFFASDRPGGEGGLDIYWVPVAQLKTE